MIEVSILGHCLLLWKKTEIGNFIGTGSTVNLGCGKVLRATEPLGGFLHSVQ